MELEYCDNCGGNSGLGSYGGDGGIGSRYGNCKILAKKSSKNANAVVHGRHMINY